MAPTATAIAQMTMRRRSSVRCSTSVIRPSDGSSSRCRLPRGGAVLAEGSARRDRRVVRVSSPRSGSAAGSCAPVAGRRSPAARPPGGSAANMPRTGADVSSRTPRSSLWTESWTFLSSRSAPPTWRPTSGSRFGPKTTNAMTRTTRISAGPRLIGFLSPELRPMLPGRRCVSRASAGAADWPAPGPCRETRGARRRPRRGAGARTNVASVRARGATVGREAIMARHTMTSTSTAPPDDIGGESSGSR